MAARRVRLAREPCTWRCSHGCCLCKAEHPSIVVLAAGACSHLISKLLAVCGARAGTYRVGRALARAGRSVGRARAGALGRGGRTPGVEGANPPATGLPGARHARRSLRRGAASHAVHTHQPWSRWGSYWPAHAQPSRQMHLDFDQAVVAAWHASSDAPEGPWLPQQRSSPAKERSRVGGDAGSSSDATHMLMQSFC